MHAYQTTDNPGMFHVTALFNQERILQTAIVPLCLAIKFFEAAEDHSACRHVQAHSKRLCGEQHLDQPLLQAET
jgi:hypothetical protein